MNKRQKDRIVAYVEQIRFLLPDETGLTIGNFETKLEDSRIFLHLLSLMVGKPIVSTVAHNYDEEFENTGNLVGRFFKTKQKLQLLDNLLFLFKHILCYI